MSIFSFIAGLFKTSFGDFIKKFFTGGLTDDLKKYGTYAVTILQHLREGINNPRVKQITDVIPGDWDNKLVEATKPILDRVLTKAMQGNGCLQKGGNLVQQFACYAEVVSSKPLAEKTKIWSNLAFDIAVQLFTVFVGKPFNLNALLIMIPSIYIQLFGKKTIELKS